MDLPDDEELATVAKALVAAVDGIEATAVRQPAVDLLARAVPGCMHLSALVAALAGCLGQLAHALADDAAGNPLADIAVDLDVMCHLLHRATLAAAPAVAGVRRIPQDDSR